MINVAAISLENEMDLVLAHKRSMKVAEKLGLTVATQTTFATAVSEIARTVIEHTDNGSLIIGLEQNQHRYGLKAFFTFESDVKFTHADEGYYYAQKLVPEFDMSESDGVTVIEMKIGLPRSLNLDQVKISLLKDFFLNEAPLNAYEELKKRNLSLNKIAEEKEEELRRSRIIDEQKTEFISIASHEIKTPITVIKAYAQMVKHYKEECDDRVKGIIDKIDQQTTKLLSLVQQLLDISKIENGNLVYAMERIELTAFIRDMIMIMKQISPKHYLSFNTNEAVHVNIDVLRMEQVFSNLLGNAVKYSPADTAIHIDYKLQNDGFVQISVKDEGIGLSELHKQSVFNKFYRVRDVLTTHSGLGMGLYVASKIIADHGGRIWVESEEGKGSTFHFTIPTEA